MALSFLRALHQNKTMQKEKILGKLFGFIYDIYSSTFRYEIHFTNPEQKRDVMDEMMARGPLSSPSLIASFHQDDFATLKKFAHRDIGILISPSKDGEMLAQACKHLGYQLIRGSSSKRPIASFIEAMKFMRKGWKFAIAVDGPRGPYGDVKKGIVAMSEKLNHPIIPMASLPDRYWELHKSWNKPRIPKPFAKVHIIFGEKKFYSRDELRDCIFELKDKLNNNQGHA